MRSRGSQSIKAAASSAAAAAVVMAGGVGAAAPTPPKMPSSSGRIVMDMAGPPMKGTQTIYWADNGKKSRQEFKGTLGTGPKTLPINGWLIYDGQYLYQHNDYQQKDSKIATRQLVSSKLAAFGAPGLSMLGLGATGGKVVGKGQVAGKPCEIRELSGMKVWVWQGLTLRLDM